MAEMLRRGEMSPLLILAALGVIFVAGLMEGIGTQTPVLLASRVPARRLTIYLLLYSILSVLGAVAWAASIALVARLLFGTTRPVTMVIQAVGLGYLPLLFAFLILLPYFGNAVGYLLHAWSLVTVLILTAAADQLSIFQALICVGGGWLLLTLVRLLLARPLLTLNQALWFLTTGRIQRLDPDEIPPILSMYVHAPSEARR